MAFINGKPLCDLCGAAIPRSELQDGAADTEYGPACADCREYYDEVRRRRRIRFHRMRPGTRPDHDYRYVAIEPAGGEGEPVSPDDCRWLNFTVSDTHGGLGVPVKTGRIPAEKHLAEWLACLLGQADAAVETEAPPKRRSA